MGVEMWGSLNPAEDCLTGTDGRMLYIIGCRCLMSPKDKYVSPKWGGDESADVPAIFPVSFDIHAAAYYGMFLIVQ